MPRTTPRCWPLDGADATREGGESDAINWLSLASFFRPLAWDDAVQWNVSAEPLYKRDTLIRVDADLVAETIAEGPDDEILAAGILERMRFVITG